MTKTSFHGLNIEKLFSSNQIEYEDWHKTDEEPQFLVHVDNEFKMFSVRQAVWVDGRGSHSFLDLETKQVVSAMSSKGFGKPKVFDYRQKWKWELNGAKCEFTYIRSPHNPEKSFQYDCSTI